jgi:TonB family protein
MLCVSNPVAHLTLGALLIFTFHTQQVDPEERFAAARQSLVDAYAQPWHRVTTFQLYDTKGKPSDRGTLEDFVVSAQQLRQVVTTTSGFTRTRIVNAEGAFNDGSASRLPFSLRMALQEMDHPLPSAGEIDGVNLTFIEPSSIATSLVAMPLDCFELPRFDDNHNLIQGDHNSTAYCFDRSTSVLRASNANGILTVFNNLTTFRGASVPTSITLALNHNKLVTLQITKLESLDSPDASLFVPAATAKAAPWIAQLPSEMNAGRMLKKTVANYPAMARSLRITGTVVIDALIGVDGHLKDIEVVASPDPLLSSAALDAVRQWVYEPYIDMDGNSAEVESTITINFSTNLPTHP